MTTAGTPIFWPPGGPVAIRDGAVACLKATGYFKNVYRQKTTPTKDDQLPVAAVWIVRDDTLPMGDANVGTPSFDHTYTLCIDVLMKAATDDALTATLDDLGMKTRTALLCDGTWRQLFEGIERCSIHPIYPKETNVTFVQAAIEVVVTFRSAWPPYLPNDLKSIVVGVEVKHAWTCPLCQTGNADTAVRCRVCDAQAPMATTFLASIPPTG